MNYSRKYVIGAKRHILLIAVGIALVLITWGPVFAQAAGDVSNPEDRAAMEADIEKLRQKAVTRWPEESPIRPTMYDEWKAKQGPELPFVHKTVSRHERLDKAAEGILFGIFVNGDLLPDIQSSLDTYIADITSEGYDVELHSVVGGTPEDLRGLLQARYAAGMAGGLLIGDMPVAWHELTCWNEYEQFPTDLYYLDLDGIWEDTNGNGVFDTHSGNRSPEIYLGRLTASTLGLGGGTEVALVNNYFAKNHLYRSGSTRIADRALIYVDDDWYTGADYVGDLIGDIYTERTVVSDPYETVHKDYEERLTHNFEFIHLEAHSDPNTHWFKIPPDDWEGTTGVGKMVSIDPKALFYNLYACSNARYVEEDYMAGWYIFCPSFGLASIGSTKVGGMIGVTYFYPRIAEGKSLGEAYFDWYYWGIYYCEMVGVADGDCWFYGMTFCGDPTLTPHRSSYVTMIADSFTDDGPGDGDGLFEQGESVRCAFALKSIGGVMARGVTLGLSCNDVNLSITTPSVYIGDLAPGSTADNWAQPLVFEIPVDYVSRIDTLFIEIMWNEGICRDTIAYQKNIGKAEILLVDDDGGDDLERYYTGYLDSCLIPCDIRDGAVTPDTALLNEYQMVIWYTGDFREDLLSAMDIATIKDYLDGGGNLMLTGQGIAAQTSVSDPDFLHNYLRADYTITIRVPLLTFEPTRVVFADIADTIAIAGGMGASNQFYPDFIVPVNGGVAELRYFDEADYGAVSYTGDYRLLFMSFGFEAVDNITPRWTSHDTLYKEILEYFGCGAPILYPTVDDLSVLPGDPMQMTDHLPMLSWTYDDPGGLPQQAYHLQVSSDVHWNEVEVWDTGPVTSSQSSTMYAGSGLEDGCNYYSRVRVNNGEFWSAWTYGFWHMNMIPVPGGLTPCDMEAVYDTLPILTHDNDPDLENDTLRYAYQLYADVDLTELVAEALDEPRDPGSTSTWQVPVALDSTADYFWRVRASDWLETGEWSEAAGFVVFPEIVYDCGDANSDGVINVGDAVFLINYVFKSGLSPDPVCLADVNGDGVVNVGDAVYLINFVFKSGLPPAEDCCP